MSIIGAFCEYLRQSGDRNTQLFEIGESPFESLLGGLPPTFGEKYRIRVIDAFAQRRPVMLNFDWIHPKANQPLEFTVVLALDSQIASSPHEYRLARGGMDVDRREALGQLLRFASSRGFDYKPIFYLIESFHNRQSRNIHSRDRAGGNLDTLLELYE